MRKFMFCLMSVLLIPVSQAYASNVGFSVGINIGVPGVVAPVYAPQPTAIVEPPEFIAPPELGFYVAIGVPYDLFFVNNLFYLYRGNAWYTSPYYNGPWESAYYGNVPYGLRSHSFERIHYYRDDYFRRYHDYRGWHGVQHFRPVRPGVGREGYGWNRTGHGNLNRPVYTAPSRPNPGNWSRPVYSPPNRNGQGNWSRPVYNVPNRSNGNWKRPVYSSPNRVDHGNMGKPVNYTPNRHDHGTRGKEGGGR